MEILVFGDIVTSAVYRERTAVYGLAYNRLNQIGIIKTPRGNFLPGGGLEGSENHTECLKREFLEETGYQIEVGDYIGCGVLYEFSPRIKEYIKGIGHFYKVVLLELQREKVDDDDDHQLTWLEPEIAENTLLLQHQSWAVLQLSKEK